ncbi:unnamed protein product [Leuciscus chuanchicus]
MGQDHYLTVTVHYIYKGSIQQKVLSTEAVYESQTGPVVAQEIHSILEEFKLTGKVSHSCQTQKVYVIQAVTRWCAKICAVVVWLKCSTMSKTVLREKQRLLMTSLPHAAKSSRFSQSWRNFIQPLMMTMAAIKEKVWGDLEKRKQEATLMDPRFKGRLEVGVAEVWDRLEIAVIDNATAAQLPIEEDPHQTEAGEEEDQAGRCMSALEQLFEDEDRELHTTQTTSSALSITEQVQKEIEIYKGLPAIPSGQDPVAWWGRLLFYNQAGEIFLLMTDV